MTNAFESIAQGLREAIARSIYCWRCRAERPMLTEEEWQRIAPPLTAGLARIKHYRQEHGCSLAEAKEQNPYQRALDVYEEITGVKENDPDALHHHRLSLYGPPCWQCGKPLRTPRAKSCVSCGSGCQSGG